MIALADLLDDTRGRSVGLGPDASFLSATADSREASAGDLFCAVRGSRVDGHRYARDAIRRGAAAALVERPVDGVPQVRVGDVPTALLGILAGQRRRFEGRVVAVTGSVGKTTTKDVLASILGRSGPTFATPGNRNSDIGLPMASVSLSGGHRFAVLEMAMRKPGEIHALATAAVPDVGIVTKIAPTHVGTLGSVEAVARAKAELLGALGPDGVAVLNADDPWSGLLRLYAPSRTVWAGSARGADLAVGVIEDRGVSGWVIEIAWRPANRRVEVRVPWPGRGARQAVALAAAAALVLGVDIETVAEAVEALPDGGGRIKVTRRDGVLILDDTYNASPDSVLASLDLLGSSGCRRCIAVLGDMRELGALSQEAHRDVGRRAARVVDVLLTVGREAAAIGDGAVREGLAPTAVRAFSRAEDVLPVLRGLLTEGDGVLIKGSRALELEQVVRGVVGP